MTKFKKEFFKAPSVLALGPGTHETFLNNQGLRIASYFWPVENAKATILLLHGHGSYVLFDWNASTPLGTPRVHEGSWIQRLNQAGFSVAAIDHQSMGFSEGHKGLHTHILKFQHLVDDILQFAKTLGNRPGFEDKRIFLLGCSLGGCIAVNAAHQAPPGLIAGCALLAPMLSLEAVSKKGMNKVLKPVGKLIASLAPAAKVAGAARNEKYAALQALYDNDPMTYTDKTRARTAMEYLDACANTVKQMPQMTFPFLTFHSPGDDMVDVESSQMLYDRSKSNDKKFVKTSGWHIISHEPGWEAVFEKVVDWVKARA